MLQNQIIPMIHAIIGDNFDQIWALQICISYYERNLRAHLNTVFRVVWLERRAVIEWSARLPNVSSELLGVGLSQG